MEWGEGTGGSLGEVEATLVGGGRSVSARLHRSCPVTWSGGQGLGYETAWLGITLYVNTGLTMTIYIKLPMNAHGWLTTRRTRTL